VTIKEVAQRRRLGPRPAPSGRLPFVGGLTVKSMSARVDGMAGSEVEFGEDPAGLPDVSGYRVERQVGQGGMGVVYRAVHLRLGRVVALKVLAPEWSRDVGVRARFDDEARIAAAIEHPSVVPLYDAGETTSGLLYLTMKFIEGTDLGALIEREGALEGRRAVALIAPVAAALDASHAAGFVHRDVKPPNVLITGGRDELAYLTDFGLTKLIAASAGVTMTGQVVGTPQYMSPEQVEGRRLDARSDVYALGCTLFHALTGHPPYRRDAVAAVMFAHVHELPPSVAELRPDLPPAFDDVIGRAMAKDPRLRYPSAGDLARAAQQAAGVIEKLPPESSVAAGEAAPTTPPPQPTTDGGNGTPPAPVPVRRWNRSTPAIIACLAAVVAVGAAVAIAINGSGKSSKSGRPAVTTVAREGSPATPNPTVSAPPAAPSSKSPFAGRWTGTATQQQRKGPDLTVVVNLKISPDGAAGTENEYVKGQPSWRCASSMEQVAPGRYLYRDLKQSAAPGWHCASTGQVRLDLAGSKLHFVAPATPPFGPESGELTRR
jgi:serine/threonine protein kinase